MRFEQRNTGYLEQTDQLHKSIRFKELKNCCGFYLLQTYSGMEEIVPVPKLMLLLSVPHHIPATAVRFMNLVCKELWS